jgi:hypothetical protein
MRATILALTIAATGLLAGYGGAQAQDKVVEGGMILGPPAVVDEPKPVGPEVYGYYEERPMPFIERERPAGRGGCGEFFYWNGNRCVDARNKL